MIELKRRSLSEMPQAIVEAWASAFSVCLNDEQKNGLILQIQAYGVQVENAKVLARSDVNIPAAH